TPEVIDPDEGPQQVEQQDDGRDEVIQRHVAAVGGVALGCLIGHGTSWSRKGRWSWWRLPGREAAGGGLSADCRLDGTASPSGRAPAARWGHGSVSHGARSRLVDFGA